MQDILKIIKKHNADITIDAHESKSAHAIKLIDAFFNYNNNGCKQTELHLKACYYAWREQFELRKETK